MSLAASRLCGLHDARLCFHDETAHESTIYVAPARAHFMLLGSISHGACAHIKELRLDDYNEARHAKRDLSDDGGSLHEVVLVVVVVLLVVVYVRW